MNPIVKICGLSSEETVDAAVEAGADMVGFVLFGKSPRHVTAARAAELAARARGRAEVVLLTVNLDDRDTGDLVDVVKPDWVQMHGDETVEQVAAIKATIAARVIKALPIGVRGDLDRLAPYASLVDRLLLDATPPKDADRHGGHGVAFDWTLVTGSDPGVPWLIAGGLNPGNVAEALAVSGADGVDVSSGVETATGQKDAELIRAFVAAARAGAVAAPAEPVAP